MKVVLIFPNGFLGKAFRLDIPMHPPLTLASLGAVLRQHDHEVVLIDAMVENLSSSRLASRVAAIDPRVIGITGNVATASSALGTARSLREHLGDGTSILFGGPWATAEHERVLLDGFADVVVMGEGEETIIELLESIDDRKAWGSIRGIAFKEGGAVVKTAQRPLIESLDALPFPAWDLLPPSSRYFFYTRGYPLYPVMTSRGCPYNCVHCTKLVFGHRYRVRSPESVLLEFEYLKREHGVKTVAIVDDTFTNDPERAERILDGLISRRLGISIMFSNGVRADTITTRLARKFKAAGVFYVGLGIESGNQHIVNQIGKKLDLLRVIRAARALRREGIITCGYYIFGHPQDDASSMWQTVRFALSLDTDYVQFFKAVPIAGTEMHRTIEEHGRFLRERHGWNTDGYNIASASFEIWNVRARDVERVFKTSYRLYYLSPRRLLRMVYRYRTITEFKWFVKSIIQIFVKNLA